MPPAVHLACPYLEYLVTHAILAQKASEQRSMPFRDVVEIKRAVLAGVVHNRCTKHHFMLSPRHCTGKGFEVSRILTSSEG